MYGTLNRLQNSEDLPRFPFYCPNYLRNVFKIFGIPLSGHISELCLTKVTTTDLQSSVTQHTSRRAKRSPGRDVRNAFSSLLHHGEVR